MPDIADYSETIQVLLGETAKYFALLVFSVLSIRLWRRLSRTAAANKRSHLILACVASAAACAIGYFSICHSMGRLYYYFGSKAFDAGNLPAAQSLFGTALTFWKNPDAVGKEGICLLLADQPEPAGRLLTEAKVLRGGRSSHFEEFYQGTFYFFHEQPDQAIPLLEASSAFVDYQWNVIRLLSAIALDKNRPDEARRLMQPYAQTEVEAGDYSHAYVAAALKLLDGKMADAKSILDRFPAGDLSPFWKPRFEKLRSKIQN